MPIEPRVVKPGRGEPGAAGAPGLTPAVRRSALPWPVSLFDPATVPAMSRANYRRELLAASLFPMTLVFFEGGALSVLVKIGYEGRVEGGLLNTITALVAVIPALANLSSFVWVRLAHGRHKVRSVVRLLAVMLGLTFAMALLPRNEAGLILTAVAALAARSCWAGVTTLRSTIWRTNYPDGVRARITSRFAMIGPTLIGLCAVALGLLMNVSEVAYRVAIPAGCLAGLGGLMCWTRVRVREHRALLRGESDAGRATGGPSFNPLRMARVLRADKDYDRFMTCQFLLGVGNITSMGLLAIVLRERFGVGYLEGLLVTTAITYVCMPVAVPLWARVFDGMHVARFRAIHSWVFVAALGVVIVALATGWFWLMFVFAVLKGAAMGGGVLGWTLGHLDFAPHDKTSEYMGVHVSLTGVRGVLGWCGVFLYEGLERVAPGAGVWVFGLCLGSVIVGALGFVALTVDLTRRGIIARHHMQDEPPQPTASSGS